MGAKVLIRKMWICIRDLMRLPPHLMESLWNPHCIMTSTSCSHSYPLPQKLQRKGTPRLRLTNSCLPNVDASGIVAKLIFPSSSLAIVPLAWPFLVSWYQECLLSQNDLSTILALLHFNDFICLIIFVCFAFFRARSKGMTWSWGSLYLYLGTTQVWWTTHLIGFDQEAFMPCGQI